MATIPFTKMHGIGNDYIYLDAFADPALADRGDLESLAVAVSDRHRGVGSDGLIVVSRPSTSGQRMGAEVRMRMFNADGSEGQMCGNGIRCVAKLVVDRAHVNSTDGDIRIETASGVLTVQARQDENGETLVMVDMGAPILELSAIPVDEAFVQRVNESGDSHEWIVDGARGVLVSMGNPHMVSFFEDDPGEDGINADGPRLERHRAFPQRVNVHYVHVQSKSEATMRTWERGSGRTQACGTGACAVLVAGVLTNRLERDALIHLPGGDLQIQWDDATNHVFMTGPATEIFQGEWPDS